MGDLKERIRNYFHEENTHPLAIEDIQELFSASTSDEITQLMVALNELENEGELVRTRKNRYGLPEKMNLIRGEIQMHKKGFAFLIPDDENQDDIFINSHDLNTAMNGDKVIVRIEASAFLDQRPEGVVLRILERANEEIVGTYKSYGKFGFVIVDDKRIPTDIFIPEGQHKGAIDGHKVIVKITEYPKEKHSAEGEVIQILGHVNDPGVDILSIIYKHGIKAEFEPETLEETQQMPEEVREEDLEGRRDLRDKKIVTIDGAEAKDLDDAIRVEKLENGHFLLGVYIADVSYYVTEGSALDKEAFLRGTSTYLTDRVIPMLPHRLSNGICSLNPQVDRLVLGCEMEIDQSGQVVKHEIFPAVIKTTERMTYSAVNAILEREEETLREKYRELVQMFEEMKALANILANKRTKRGAIDFDFKEAGIVVDETGKPTDVKILERGIGERMIESFMLAANETIAEHFHWMDVPFIHRIHEDPDSSKLERFYEFIGNLGLSVKGTTEQVHPKALQQLLEELKGRKEDIVVSKLMLRSMQQAKYSHESVGHFGLATDFYTHFTSPIRRYPDLIVHRLIRTYLINGDLSEKTIEHWNEKLPDIARLSSEAERRSVDAERETDDLKKAEFMSEKIGEEFEAIISSVTNFGLFVELPNTIEGLVHVSYMTDDYYHFDDKQQVMIGERTARTFRVGDEVRVRLIGTNIEERAIDFELVDMEKKKRKPKIKKRI